MRRTRRIASLTALVVFGAGLFLFLRSREPWYQGKTAAWWFDEFRAYPRSLIKPKSPGRQVHLNLTRVGRQLYVIDPRGFSGLVQDPPMEALRAMGSNAVPYLIRRLEAKESALAAGYARFFLQVPAAIKRWLPQPVPASQIQVEAAMALVGIGEAAEPAVPTLIGALIREPRINRSNPLASATVYLSEYKTAAFDQVLEEFSQHARYDHIVALIKSFDLKNDDTVRALAYVLKSGDPDLREWAARLLGHHGSRAAPASAALAVALKDSSHEVRYLAALALFEIGPAAAVALPVLATNSLNDESPMVRSRARRAIQAIDPALAEEQDQ